MNLPGRNPTPLKIQPNNLLGSRLNLPTPTPPETIQSPFKIRTKKTKLKTPRYDPFNLTPMDEDDDPELQSKAFESLLQEDDCFGSCIITEMFGYKELDRFVTQELVTVTPGTLKYYNIKLLWVDYLLQDQKYCQALGVLNELLPSLDIENDSITYSRVLLGLGKVSLGQWKLQEASDYLQQAACAEERVTRDGEIGRELEIKRCFGIVCFRQAKYSVALERFRECLSAATEKLGEIHPWIVTVVLDIAFVLEHQWGLNEALRLCREALTAQKKYFETTVYQMARSYELMGTILFKEGSHLDAIKVYEKSLGILTNYRGKKHTDFIQIYLRIASVHISLADVDKAIDILERCLKALKASEMGDDPTVSKTHFLLGTAFFYKKKFYDSIKNYLVSWRMNMRIFGTKHPSVANDCQVIGRALTIQGRYREASEMLDKSNEIKLESLGENTFETGNSYYYIGLNYLFQGAYRESMINYKKSLLIFERCLSREHYHLALPYTGIARVYSRWGQPEKALIHYEKALDLWRMTYGNCHPKVASTYAEVGSCYVEIEAFDRAIDYYVKALMAGYASPVRDIVFEKKTAMKQRDSKIFLNLLTTLEA